MNHFPTELSPSETRRPRPQWVTAQRLLLAAGCVLLACTFPNTVSESRAYSSNEGGVLTSRNDNYRTGANTDEKKLKPNKIDVNSFGLLYTRQVDGKIYAQPLYAPKVKTADKKKHDVVYVATAHNTVFAFDASDTIRETPLWSRNLGPSVPNDDLTNPALGRLACGNIVPEVGISGTPTIDMASETMYVVAKIKENGQWFNRLFALDIGTGEFRRPPIDIGGSVPGTGDGSVGGVLEFDGRRHNQRTGLLLSNGMLYIAFAGHCDNPPHHGWVFAYKAATLKRKAMWVTTPDGEAGGIWQSGGGLSADHAGRIYFAVGQGVNPPYVGRVQNGFGQTIGKLRFHDNILELEDWFIPWDFQAQNEADADMSFGPIIIPNSNLAAGLMIGRGRQSAKMYVVQRDNFGHFHENQSDEVTQSVDVSDPDFTADPQRTDRHWVYSTVYWNGRLYVWAMNDFPRAYAVQGTSVSPMPVATGSTKVFSAPVTGMLSVSAHGNKDGIVWGSVNVEPSTATADAISQAVLYAFDAVTLQELWNSRQNRPRDEVGLFPKFAQPIIGGGKVFMANHSNQLKVYGLYDTDDDDDDERPRLNALSRVR